MSPIWLVFGILLVLSLVPLAYVQLRAYWKHRGTRVVACPETGDPAAVRLDAAYAAKTGVLGESVLRIDSCSRWPERAACGRDCLSQLEAAPAECLVKTTLVDWYAGSACASCGKPIGEIHWVEHKPALLTPGRETVEWKDVAPEELPRVLATHQRVCWTCHTSHTLRERLPGLVLDPPETLAERS